MQNFENENTVTEKEEQDALNKKFLTFWTAKELFGIPITDVVQIISMQEITALPDFPDYAKGVINLRGNIIPVIDMRIRFGKPEIEYNESTCIIVTSIDDTYMGFIVDAVDEVTDIDDESISPPPKVSKDITNRYLTGIGQTGNKVVLLLDTAKILTENEFEIVTQTLEQNETEDKDSSKEQDSQSSNGKEPVESSKNNTKGK